jgi:hypothetical protein
MTKQNPDFVGRGGRPTVGFIVVGAGPAGAAPSPRVSRNP